MYISHTIGQFSEAGLHEWMPVVIFHTRCHEAAASLPGWFLSRHCFTLSITMEVEPWIVKQNKCYRFCRCNKYQGEGMEGRKKCLCIIFGGPEDCEFMGHPIAQATSYCLLPDTFWLRTSKIAFKFGSVKFANSLSLPSTMKKVCSESKNRQVTEAALGKSQGS